MSAPVHRVHRRAGGGGSAEGAGGFVPAPSVGHEIGVMFAGIVAMLLGMFAFQLWWKLRLEAEEKAEAARVEGLRSRGLLKEQRTDLEEIEVEKREVETTEAV